MARPSSRGAASAIRSHGFSGPQGRLEGPDPTLPTYSARSQLAEAPVPIADWRETCRKILQEDQASLCQLRAGVAVRIEESESSHLKRNLGGGAFKGLAQEGVSIGKSAELGSGRQYPHRSSGGTRSVVKDLPKVPVPRPHSVSQMSARHNLARKNMGLAPTAPTSRGSVITPRQKPTSADLFFKQS
eukprot:TRINITY_DN94521_c0_g1_i1.p1 TRINITY_DN94521_c0_g1~~TRINITY_DN94521_c0_g1_i1.p1  ORF type:complete len:187 (-),score=22.95 TRINITY_DN94521_c0_g1_i1:15-575(-)